MAIQCLVGEKQNFITDPMLHGSPMQFSQHRANMVIWSNLHFWDIILAALFCQHCCRSKWDCFAPYNRLLQKSRRDVTMFQGIFFYETAREQWAKYPHGLIAFLFGVVISVWIHWRYLPMFWKKTSSAVFRKDMDNIPVPTMCWMYMWFMGYRNWYQYWGHCCLINDCGELPRSLMRQQWPKLRYQFLFYHDETKLMMNKQILSI